jgi:hypothetical protein
LYGRTLSLGYELPRLGAIGNDKTLYRLQHFGRFPEELVRILHKDKGNLRPGGGEILTLTAGNNLIINTVDK